MNRYYTPEFIDKSQIDNTLRDFIERDFNGPISFPSDFKPSQHINDAMILISFIRYINPTVTLATNDTGSGDWEAIISEENNRYEYLNENKCLAICGAVLKYYLDTSPKT